MKTLKIILVSLGGIILIFFSLGLFVPSYDYQSSIIVNASPTKCWEVFHDTKRMGEWIEGFESLTLKDGESMTPGASYEIVINDEGTGW